MTFVLCRSVRVNDPVFSGVGAIRGRSLHPLRCVLVRIWSLLDEANTEMLQSS